MDNTFIENLPNNEQIYWEKALKVNPKQGLTDALINESNNLYGPNKLTVKGSKSLLAQILEHFKELITILLLIAAILAFFLGIMTVIQHPKNSVDYIPLFIQGTVICGIIFTNIFLSIKQSDKTNKALQSLKNLNVPMAKIIRNGQVRLIPSIDIVPGDIMVLEAGEAIAADAKLIEATNLKINEAVLTGESTEVEKNASYKSDAKQPIGDRKD